MKYLYKLLPVFLLSFVYEAASAVTMVEMKQADGGIDKIYFDGMTMRVDSSVEPEYIIIDANKGEMFIVSTREKQIIVVGNLFEKEKSNDKPRFKVDFVDKGKGPSIAGFQTQHFEVLVNGKKCSDEFTSKTMLKSLGIENALEKSLNLASAQKIEMMMNMDECEQAESTIAAMYSKHGYALRSIDANGALEFEVISASKNAAAPPGGFSLPAGYKRVDMAQMMQDMEHNMPDLTQEGMENMSPQQRQQLQQMMQGIERDMPEVTPEEMETIGTEQARKMQQMMEQMFKPKK